MEPNTPYWLIRNSFLKSPYALFDLGNSWSVGDGTEVGVQGMGNLGITTQSGLSALSAVNEEIVTAMQTDGAGVNGMTSGMANLMANESVPAVSPIGSSNISANHMGHPGDLTFFVAFKKGDGPFDAADSEHADEPWVIRLNGEEICNSTRKYDHTVLWATAEGIQHEGRALFEHVTIQCGTLAQSLFSSRLTIAAGCHHCGLCSTGGGNGGGGGGGQGSPWV